MWRNDGTFVFGVKKMAEKLCSVWYFFYRKIPPFNEQFLDFSEQLKNSNDVSLKLEKLKGDFLVA